MASHVTDWFPGGRYGTQEAYGEGWERTFGKKDEDIFKNLDNKKDKEDGDGSNRG